MDPATCDDGIQNQGETDVDCGGSCDPCLGPVDPASRCIDGRDNDGDGFIDLADPGCEDVWDNDETDPDIAPPTPPPETCSDGIQNQGEEAVDCGGPNCVACQVVDPVYACSDGIDNDGDFKIDFPADVGCTSVTDDDEFNAISTIATCVDTDDVTGEENKGSVTGNFFGNPFGPIEDSCWSIYVKEYFCQDAPYGRVGGLHTFKYRLCPNGCSDGACN